MQNRNVGPFSVNPVGLGCMNMMHAYNVPIPEEESDKLLNRALDLGYDFLDTATIYGMGESERRIGKFLKHRRDEFTLASKCVLGVEDGRRVLDARPEKIKAACEASLKRLQTDVIAQTRRFRSKIPWGLLLSSCKKGRSRRSACLKCRLICCAQRPPFTPSLRCSQNTH